MWDSNIKVFNKSVTGGNYLLFDRWDYNDNSYILINDEGNIIVFNITNGEIILKKRVAYFKLKTAVIYDEYLILADINYKVIILTLPELLIWDTFNLKDNGVSVEKDNIEISVYHNDTIVFLLDRVLMFYNLKKSEDFEIYQLPDKIRKPHILSPLNSAQLKLITDDLKEYEVKISKNGKTNIHTVNDYKADEFVQRTTVFKKKKVENKDDNSSIIVFHEPGANHLLIIDDLKSILIRIGLELRLKFYSVFFNHKTEILLLGGTNGRLYFINPKKKRDLNYIKICESEIDFIDYIDNKYFIFDREGGVYILNNDLNLEKTLFNPIKLNKIFIYPDYESKGVIMAKTSDGKTSIIDYENSSILFSPKTPLFYKSFGEGVLENNLKRIILFSGDGSMYNYTYDGKRKKMNTLGPRKPYVIKKYDNKYFIGTSSGVFLIYDKYFRILYRNRISRESILMFDIFKIEDNIYITFSTANGSYLLFDMSSDTVPIRKEKVSGIIINNPVITLDENNIKYFIYTDKTNIIAVDIKNKKKEYKIKLPENTNISDIFILSSFRAGEIGILFTTGIIYKINISHIKDNEYEFWDDEKILYEFDRDIDETTFITMGDDIIVADMNLNIIILRYKGYKETKLTIGSEVLSLYEYYKRVFIISTAEGELLFVDMDTKKYKKEVINDWILNFYKIDKNNFIGISYKGKIFNFYVESEKLDYKIYELNLGRIFSSAFDYFTKNIYLINADLNLYKMSVYNRGESLKLLKRNIDSSNMAMVGKYLLFLPYDNNDLQKINFIIYDTEKENFEKITVKTEIDDAIEKEKVLSGNLAFFEISDTYFHIIRFAEDKKNDIILLCKYFIKNNKLYIKCAETVNDNEIRGIYSKGGYIYYSARERVIKKILKSKKEKWVAKRGKVKFIKRFDNILGIVYGKSIEIENSNPFSQKIISFNKDDIYFSDKMEYNLFEYFYNFENIKGGHNEPT